jgi:hypothetical protein
VERAEDVAGCLLQRCGLHTSPGVERGGGGCSGGGGRAACYRTWPPLPSVQCAACHCPTRSGLCLFIVYFSLSLSRSIGLFSFISACLSCRQPTRHTIVGCSMSATYWKYDSSVGQPPPSAASTSDKATIAIGFPFFSCPILVIIIEPGKNNTWEKEAANMAAVAAHLFLSVGLDWQLFLQLVAIKYAAAPSLTASARSIKTDL